MKKTLALHLAVLFAIAVAAPSPGPAAEPVAAAEKRLRALAGLEPLAPNLESDALAEKLCDALRIPKRAAMDAYHLAFAVHYELEYLLTWNCTHLANAGNLRLLADYTAARGLWLPIICMPAEMVEQAMEK